MIDLCTDFVNPHLKSIYFAIQNQLKMGNYRNFTETPEGDSQDTSPISDEYKLVKKSVESLIVLWHAAHENDRYKEYYETVLVPKYFIFPSDYDATVKLLKNIDFSELLVLISPITVRESLSEDEKRRLDELESQKDQYHGRGTLN